MRNRVEQIVEETPESKNEEWNISKFTIKSYIFIDKLHIMCILSNQLKYINIISAEFLAKKYFISSQKYKYNNYNWSQFTNNFVN